MDQFDVALLNQIQDDNKLTADQLSDSVGLSPSACQRRLKQLREKGVIEKDISIISPEAVGYNMTMIVEVTLEREQLDLIDKFKRSMLQIPEVTHCYYVTGAADFIMIITTKDMKHYEKLSRKLFHENPNIRRFHTNVVMDRVKSTSFISIEPTEE